VTQWKVEFYTFEEGGSLVYDWYLEQGAKVKAKFARIFEIAESRRQEFISRGKKKCHRKTHLKILAGNQLEILF